jgi:uncharacterized repeat protein (TIGR03809 family)
VVSAGQRKGFVKSIERIVKRFVCCVRVDFLLADSFMTHRSDVARGREILGRWCLLAEQRLDYLTELFETGRWRRYYSDTVFLENIQEAKAAVQTWRTLLTQHGASDNSAVDSSWLDGRKPLPPRRNSIAREEIRLPLPRSLQIIANPTPPAPRADPSLQRTPSGQVETVSTANDNAWRQGLNLTAMQQRYPLLRNAL